MRAAVVACRFPAAPGALGEVLYAERTLVGTTFQHTCVPLRVQDPARTILSAWRNRAPPAFDVSVAHPALIYDYWLGGKDNFAAVRRAAEEVVYVTKCAAT
jgi:S-adenosyl methyltransferase